MANNEYPGQPQPSSGDEASSNNQPTPYPGQPAYPSPGQPQYAPPSYPLYPPPSQPLYPQQSGIDYPPSQPPYALPSQPFYQPQPGMPYPPNTQPPSAYYPPPSPPKRRLKAWHWILIGVGSVLVLCCACGSFALALNGNSPSSSNQQSASVSTDTPYPTATFGPTDTPAPTATATPTPKWTTVQKFKGNGIKKTGIFSVPDDWKLVWTCNPSSYYFGQYNVIVTVYSSDGTPLDLAVNTICKSGNTGDSTEEHQGGDIYLDIDSEAAWTIQVQVLK
ncbi:MAG: hypothetical protein OJF49_003773 [Ktedonobacterales bacterium]|nr:MAG: hypothetical protein OJF49_003773 [Ktedonobacterales bacterium]